MDIKSRKVVTRSGRRYRGYFPSWKMKRHIEWESLLERDAILLFEFSRGVASYREQPEMIEYEFEGEIHRYYPDFEVILKSGEIIHFEVKPASKLTSAELIKKLSAIKLHYERMGRDFRILSSDQIQKYPRHSNLMCLTKFQFNQGDISRVQSKVFKAIKADPNSTLGSLANKYGLVNTLILISRGLIFTDIDICIDFNSGGNQVRLVTEDDHDSLLF